MRSMTAALLDTTKISEDFRSIPVPFQSLKASSFPHNQFDELTNLLYGSRSVHDRHLTVAQNGTVECTSVYGLAGLFNANGTVFRAFYSVAVILKYSNE